LAIEISARPIRSDPGTFNPIRRRVSDRVTPVIRASSGSCGNRENRLFANEIARASGPATSEVLCARAINPCANRELSSGRRSDAGTPFFINDINTLHIRTTLSNPWHHNIHPPFRDLQKKLVTSKSLLSSNPLTCRLSSRIARYSDRFCTNFDRFLLTYTEITSTYLQSNSIAGQRNALGCHPAGTYGCLTSPSQKKSKMRAPSK
jgi:hypothetical protein